MLRTTPSIRRLLADRRATAALEFAIVAFPLLALSLGAIILGLILWTQCALQSVAADAARCGAIQGTACTGSNTILSYVQTEAQTMWALGAVVSSTGAPLTVHVNSGSCSSISVGSAAFETVQIQTSFFASWLPFLFNSYTINVCASYAKSS